MNHILEQTGLQFFSWNWNPNFETLAAEHPIRYMDVFKENFKWLIEEIVEVQLGDENYLLKASDHRELATQIAQAQRSGEWGDLSKELAQRTAADEVGISNMESEVQKWTGKWIPIPYVETIGGLEEQSQSQIAPRLFISPQEEGFHCTVCINTNVAQRGSFSGRKYGLAKRTESILRFVDESHGNILTGRQDYLETIYYPNQDQRNEGKGRHIASYAGLIKALGFDLRSEIQFGTSTGATCNVDCFIDLGNSNTSVVLLEHDPHSLDFFHKCSALVIHDLTNPAVQHTGSFPSKVAFSRPSFSSAPGLLDNDDYKWPSPARIGHEAESIIEHLDFSTNSMGGPSFLSSPKRYLWDLQEGDEEWRYANVNPTTSSQDAVDIAGFTRSGELVTNQAGDTLAGAETLEPCFGQLRFSKSSINRFFFLEVFQHVFSQINSSKYRKNKGDTHKTRHLRHVVVSCPTGMLQSEQVQLRRYAEEAIAYLTNHPEFTPGGGRHVPEPAIQIHPSVKDVQMRIDSLGNRKEWMYDEATTTQLLYLYSTLQYKFNRNVESFSGSFQLENNSIRIGVVDLGGGTCDLMVCDHSCSTQNDAVHVTPDPIFWDSWMQAGDDLRKELIEKILIPNLKEQVAELTGNDNHHAALTQLLSDNVVVYDAQRVKLLRGFMQQIAFPITTLYLSKANEEVSEVIGFSEAFANQHIHASLLEQFYTKTGADFTRIRWTMDSKKINDVATAFFQKQLNSISGILGSLGCDIVLLSGGTFRLQCLEDLFASSMGMLEHRIQNLNRWKPGNWHPFTEATTGKLQDIKSHVTLGSAIAFHAGSTRTLHGFALNPDKLKTEIRSTAVNVWRKEAESPENLLNSEAHSASVTAQTLPLSLYVSSIQSPNYPVKPAYIISVNESGILKTLEQRGLTGNELAIELNQKIQGVQAKCPLTFKITRDPSNGYESVSIEDVTDQGGNTLPSSQFQLIQQTLPEEEYWMEKGVQV